MMENTEKLVREVVLTRHAVGEAERLLERAKRELERARESADKAIESFQKSGEDGQFVFRGVLIKRWTARTLDGKPIVEVRIEEAKVVPEPRSSLNLVPGPTS